MARQMLEIPPSKDTDAEDVVWGLQTADTLWRRGERIDALVWLRRAAQAAGDANDDDRALELARHAAELTEWMANADDADAPASMRVEEAVEEAVEEVIEVDVSAEPEPGPGPEWVHSAVTTAPPAATAAPPPLQSPPRVPPPSQGRLPNAVLLAPDTAQAGESSSSAVDEARPDALSVLPAEKVHAGMFDPWADQSSQLAPASPGPAPAPPSSHGVAAPDEEEVVTSVRPQALSRPGSEPLSSVSVPVAAAVPVSPPPKPSRPNVGSKPPAPRPPPLPPRARPPLPKPSVPAAVAEPPRAASTESSPPSAPSIEARDDVTSADVAMPDVPAYVPSPDELSSVAPPPADEATSADEAAADETSSDVVDAPSGAYDQETRDDVETQKLDLDDVEAFADLPDDARAAFAGAATLHALAEGEEIGSFALAYVLSGSFDVAATVVDAPAVRLSDGAVLRARGTTDENVPIRLICAKARGVLATWSDAAVSDAFRSIPWVEEDLRAAADRVQTLVGITIGPLGERLDVSIREEIVGRLTMRPLIPGEIVVSEGDSVPGLLLVGIGELELVKNDAVIGQVSSGDFLFASEVLGAGSAPATARAGKGGALVMFGDRRIAQELLVTCPPLLEVFAGM